jgi:hypothetical protein
LKIVRDFVRRKSQERKLKDRLHAIWFVFVTLSLGESTVVCSRALLHRYCIPMDNDRPELDTKYFDQICPDKSGMWRCNVVNCD